MISTPVFSILLNETPTSTFNPTQGLRQGDPLSPFLFIIVAEELGRYIKKEAQESRIKVLRIWGNDLAITHQEFVDDIMLFCQVSLREARRMKEILNNFMEASGTQINNEKSCTFFFNMPGNIKSYLARIMGFSTSNLPTKYLGTPLLKNPLKLAGWQQTIQNIQGRFGN